MSNEIVISLEKVSKKYHLGEPRKFTEIFDYIFHNRRDNIFWALKDISIKINKGEAVGIVGPNGSGKSTILKIIAGIVTPTKGKVEVIGKVAALLELGTGFHTDLTGRENIFLYGAIMGMSPDQIRKKFEKIVDFSGVREFIDTPLKHYSSGMRVRLAFSVAINIDPDILVVDEALAVGDVEFQQKCLQVFENFRKKKLTMVIVSHDLSLLKKICPRLILNENGGIKN